MNSLVLDGQPLTLAEIEAVACNGREVELSPASRERMNASRKLVEQILAAGETVYGVNTGFARLSDVRVPDEQLAELQTNLVRSHSGGVGGPLSIDEVRAMLLLRANVLAKGASGCRIAVPELLVAMLNAGVSPVIPEKGSVGASGDLAPLAHLALVVIG
jgi:histidine ammonia-lyase